MMGDENFKTKAAHFHTPTDFDDCPEVAVQKCIMEVPAAAEAKMGTPLYYSIAQLDDTHGKRTQYTRKILPTKPWPPQVSVRPYKPVKWENIDEDTRERLLDKHCLLSEEGCTDIDWSRLTNFLVRHIGCGHTSPDYYLNYGYYYCKMFIEETRPNLSPKGQAWLDLTLLLLQDKMEDGLVQNMRGDDIKIPSKMFPDRSVSMQVPRYELETTNDKFKKFAFSTHPQAYLEAGLMSLWPKDLYHIASTPDIQEWMDSDTWQQMWDVGKEYFKATPNAINDYPEDWEYKPK